MTAGILSCPRRRGKGSDIPRERGLFLPRLRGRAGEGTPTPARPHPSLPPRSGGRGEPLWLRLTLALLLLATLAPLRAQTNAGAPSTPLATERPQASRAPGADPLIGVGGMCLAPGTGSPGGECTSGPASQPTRGPGSGAGNPIDLASGNKYQQDTDLPALPGVLGLELERHYNSRSRYQGLTGYGWRLSYEAVLHADARSIQIIQADGRRIIFPRDPANPNQCASANPQDGRIEVKDNTYEWHWPSGRVLVFGKWNARAARLETIKERSGEFVSLAYGPKGELLSITDPQQRKLAFHYLAGAKVQLVERIDTPVGTWRYRYDEHNRLIAVEPPADPTIEAGAQVTRRYHYEPDKQGGDPYNLTGISVEVRPKEGAAGSERLSTYSYDAQDRAISSERGAGLERITLGYAQMAFDAHGRPLPGRTELTNSLGERSSYTWTEIAGRLVLLEARGPGCAHCPEANIRYRYDARGNLIEVLRADEALRYSYDSAARLTRIEHQARAGGKPNGAPRLVARYEYQGGFDQPSLIARPSVVTGREHSVAIRYDERGQPSVITEHGFAPNVEGLLHAGVAGLRKVGLTQPVPEALELTRTTTLAYDGSRLIAVDGPLPGAADVTRIDYDARGQIATLRLPENLTFAYRYDEAGRVIGVALPGGAQLGYAYDAAGRINRLSRGGAAEHYWHDANGRLAQALTFAGQRLFVDYDAAGRIVAVFDGQNNRIRLDYDAEGRLLARALLNPDGSVAQRVGEDALLEARSHASPYVKAALMPQTSSRASARRVSLGLDMAEQAVADPRSLTARLHFDALNRLSAVVDARQLKTGYTHDDFGRLIRVDSPDSGVTSYAYDESDRLVAKTTGTGQASNYRYDAAGRLIEARNADGITRIDYAANGRPARIVFPAGEERYRYDPDGRLAAHTRLIDGRAFTTAYRYDTRGELAEKTLPDGQTLTYAYNGALHAKPGLLSAIARKGHFASTSIVTGLNEAQDGYADQRFSFGNGLEFVRQLDQHGALARLGTPGVSLAEYGSDALSGTRAIAAHPSESGFAYDALGRLMGAVTPAGRTGLAWDAGGNPLAILHERSLSRFAIDAASNRIRAERRGEQTLEYAYNGAGSLTQAGTRRYAYDAEQRPVKVFEGEALIAEYAYNAFGERIKKVAYSANQKKVTYFLYDGSQLAAEADESGQLSAHYVWLDDQPVAKLEGQSVLFIHADHLGAPRAVTDKSKNIVWRADYTALGQAALVASRIELNLRGSNQYFDAESGLHYNTRRSYDPATGRYLTPDPTGQRGGLNLYAFADNDPAGRVDPLGLQAKPALDNTARMSFSEKLREVFLKAGPHVAPDVAQVLKEMVSPTSLATTAGVFAVWGALQFTPVGWVADAVMVGLAYYQFGSAAVDLVKGLISLIEGINNARCDSDLEGVAEQLSNTIAVVSVTAGAGLLLKKVFGRTEAEARRAPPQNGRILDPPDPKTVVPWRARALNAYDTNRRGLIGELEVSIIFEAKGFTPLGNTVRGSTVKNEDAFEALFKEWNGQKGIDGLFKRVDPSTGKTEYWIVESKATGATPARDPCGTVGKLCNTRDGRQLSDDWLLGNINKFGLSPVESRAIRDAINKREIRRVYAQTDPNGTRLFEVNPVLTGDAIVGGEIKL